MAAEPANGIRYSSSSSETPGDPSWRWSSFAAASSLGTAIAVRCSTPWIAEPRLLAAAKLDHLHDGFSDDELEFLIAGSAANDGA